MVEYNIRIECRHCRTWFVVGRRESKRIYCDKCEKKANK